MQRYFSCCSPFIMLCYGLKMSEYEAWVYFLFSCTTVVVHNRDSPCFWENHTCKDYLTKNSQTVKKVRPMQKRSACKKLWNQRWRPRSGCGGLIMAKILIATIQANFCSLFQLGIGTELLLLKILPLSDHHNHFCAATFDFTTFSCCLFLH